MNLQVEIESRYLSGWIEKMNDNSLKTIGRNYIFFGKCVQVWVACLPLIEFSKIDFPLNFPFVLSDNNFNKGKDLWSAHLDNTISYRTTLRCLDIYELSRQEFQPSL